MSIRRTADQSFIDIQGAWLMGNYRPADRLLSIVNGLSLGRKEKRNKNRKAVLMVCTANICRSPIAEVILQQRLISAGLADRIKVGSAGVRVHEVGHEADMRAQKIGVKRGLDLGRSRARQIRSRDFSRYDYILAMDKDNLQVLDKMCPEEDRHKLAMVMDFAPELGTAEVPDPYYSNAAGFEVVFDLLESAIDNFLLHIHDAAG